MNIFVLVVLLFIYGRSKKKEKLDATFQNKIKTAAIIIAVLSLIDYFSSGLFSTLISIILTLFSPICIIIFIIWLLNRKKDTKRREETYNTPQYTYNKPRPLDKSAKVRRKVITQFNKMYDLTLTEDQIDCIVNASYVSPQ